MKTMPPAQPGISVLLAERGDLLRGRRVGVLSGPSGVLPDLTGSAEALIRRADVRALFGAEHGLLGAAAEGAPVANGRHASGVPIYSLYGANQAPSEEQLAGLDLLVCDVQDVGCRFYTYAWSLVKLMQAAASAGVAVIVADRPNPIGAAVEGPGVEPAFRSLVGLHDVPIRHGLTLGELALLAQAELSIHCDLTIIPCDGWRRAERWSATGLPWAPPSPNMPTAETALLYPGTCLAEGTNLSVGRGTARPFEWLGAPWVNGPALAAALNRTDLPGVRWRAVAFSPCSGPHAGALCHGVQPHVVDLDALQPVLVGVGLLCGLQQLHPAELAWNEAHFDRLAGSAGLRQAIVVGETAIAIARGWRANEREFQRRAAPFLRYG